MHLSAAGASEPQMGSFEPTIRPRGFDKMSLPGLGLAAPQEVTAQLSTTHELAEGTEWRFEVAFSSVVEIKVRAQRQLPKCMG